MAEIIKQEQEILTKTKLIGKRYQGKLTLPALWQEWFSNSGFAFADKLPKEKVDSSYVGLMRWKAHEEQNFEYWIGVLVDEDVKEDDLMELAFPTNKAATFYLQGVDGPELYSLEGKCHQIVTYADLFTDKDGYMYSIERYNCPRFTTPNEKGEVILDYVMLVK